MPSSGNSAKDVPGYQVAALILGVVALKAAFIFSSLPSMWIWADEGLYYTTAYDLFHPGSAGVPHPGFLNYPPLTSVLIAPVHFFDLPSELGYPLSLIILSLTQALGALAVYLTVVELFGFKSRALLALLLIGPPAYMGFCLMSETLFVALYLWLLYFYVRQLKTDRVIYAVIVGLLIAAMILTRRVGVGLFASVAASAVFAFIWTRDARRYWRQLGSHAVTLLVGGSLAIGWKLVLAHGFEARYGYLGASGYLERGFLPALASVDAFQALTQRFVANLGYISLSTYGVCVPLVLWHVFLRPGAEGEEERRELLQRLVFHVMIFALFAAFAAAVHMFVNKHKPSARYLMFGRYVEFFSPLLLALSFGLMAKARGWRWSWVPVSLAGALSLVLSLLIPSKVFVREGIAPNNMGLGWIVGLAGDSPGWAGAVGPIVAIVVVAFITSPFFSSSRPAKLAGCLSAFVLLSFNLAISLNVVADKSQKFHKKFGAYSAFLAENEELTADGLFIDDRIFNAKRKIRDRRVSKKVLVDHVAKAVVGRDVKPFLGKVPVFSPRRLDEYEILFREKGFSPKIYGEKKKREK